MPVTSLLRSKAAVQLARWCTASIVAGTITWVIELGGLVVGDAPMRWRLPHAAVAWAGHVALVLAIAALLAAARLARLLLAPESRERALGTIVAPALALSFVLLRPLAKVGDELASGDWISQQWFAEPVAWLPHLAVLCAALAALALTRAPAQPRRTVIGVLLVAAIATLAVLDRQVMPGLMPRFHALVEGGLALATFVAALRALPAEPRRPLARTLGALVGSTLALALWLGSTTQIRGALVLRSSFARVWMPLTLPAARTTVLRDVLAELDVRARPLPAPTVVDDLSAFRRPERWNLVLVVVDTMRADTLPPVRPPEGLPFARPGDTPRIDAWLETAHRFEVAYAPASTTKGSMPAMLRSREVSDPPLSGETLAERMARLGVVPLAVVHSYFKPARRLRIEAALDGFARVVDYGNEDAASAVSRALELAGTAPQPFVLMLHLYGLHRPGFDGRPISGSTPRIEAYRRSLTYVDAQFAALLDGLSARGLTDRTVVVLTSDHGEGLGDHGTILHGPTVFDEDVRVPLAFAIPGQPGRVIHETVGTVDLLPTLLDLQGAAPDPADRGRSLLPLFAAEPREPTRPYYFENWDLQRMGVVVGRDKLVHDRALGLSYRFALDRDPDELDDLHEPDDTFAALLRHIVVRQPAIAQRELADASTRALLLARLRELDADDPGPTLPLLVRLVGLAPRGELLERCAELFVQGSTATRVELAQLAGLAPDPMGRLVREWIYELAGTPTELELVDALARRGTPAFEVAAIAGRMAIYADTGAPITWTPWLRLVRAWQKPAEHFEPVLARMLARATREHDVPSEVLRLVRSNAAAMKKQEARRRAREAD